MGGIDSFECGRDTRVYFYFLDELVTHLFDCLFTTDSSEKSAHLLRSLRESEFGLEVPLHLIVLEHYSDIFTSVETVNDFVHFGAPFLVFKGHLYFVSDLSIKYTQFLEPNLEIVNELPLVSKLDIKLLSFIPS